MISEFYFEEFDVPEHNANLQISLILSNENGGSDTLLFGIIRQRNANGTDSRYDKPTAVTFAQGRAASDL